ncbi:uncharacterized protein LOC112055196 [Bicyclus anynana]|uniref:Uncharacterized protein LOC112055196 n=1 Tax=Bicyclus anynana TaxID=110368 RepID=A0ABM3LN83_BICAN|nr:uncharacterized protein LOC112055196 [Bicyclus anynana]
MAIPPFPSHDLAKLVLGYLAEEQLMTAYDEFLQASPYLDVLRNEYDRIFMTSLKSILAEYRAVKIYVETCKPFLLRKKLFQCSNLLEIVKFLVNHIDINRLQSQESANDKSSYNKHTLYTKTACDVCNTLNLSACECRSGATRSGAKPGIHPSAQTAASSPETSTETTSLADLPGNSVTKRNTSREFVVDNAHTQINLVQQISQSSFIQSTLQRTVEQLPQRSIVQQMYMTVKNPNFQHNDGGTSEGVVQELPNSGSDFNKQGNTMVKSDESKQKIDEFNTIYNLVCSNNNTPTTQSTKRNSFLTENSNKQLSSAGSFQEFATGVTGNSDKEKPIVPDSSTSENFNTQTTSIQENSKNVTPNSNMRGPMVAQYFFKARTISTPYLTLNQDSNNTPKSTPYIKIREKPDDPKVTILSDVKVDNRAFKSRNCVKMPQVLTSNTANPMLQMQSIYINGTPAYTNTRQNGSIAYTKDEIMAMPTLIVVPSSGVTQSVTATYSQSNISNSTNTITTTTSSTQRVLEPLVIDVSTYSPTPKKKSHLPDLNTDNPKTEASEGLVKTVETTAVSLPKDTNVTVSNKTSTPHCMPLTRKSSSTPRRNSHVRVLDFATPRRILTETINENDTNQISTESSTNGTEVVVNSQPDMIVHTNILTDDKCEKKSESKNMSKKMSTKENKSKSVKKSDWDAALRALALGKEAYEEPVVIPKPKIKKTKKKKKIVSPVADKVPDTPIAKNIKTKHSTSHSTTKSDESIKSIEIVENSVDKVAHKYPVPVTTINISDGGDNDLQTTNKTHIKVNTSDDRVETPEAERLSLQNVIGAKLNISDLLETPYKQVLYDIQMETPKFLGPDLPGEPFSDIKIMNIPTPRFLNTPKPLQATPSYASRPTDYSSGSSYYKPDDHDYVPSSDVLHCTEAVIENTIKPTNLETVSVEPKKKGDSEKPSRPKRKCTKNVSYKNLSNYKTKDDDSFEAASVSSGTSNKSIRDKKINKSIDSKAGNKSNMKSVTKKKIIVYKSPSKPKNFMKIKPRRSTPIKETASKGRKKLSELSDNSPSISRKRTSSKDKTTITPIVIAGPTKSRRKSSTPRKLNCTKPFSAPVTLIQNSSSLANNKTDVVKEIDVCQLQDSDNEQICLRWSEDGSQDAPHNDKEEQPTSSSLPEEDDITKIKEYIATSTPLTIVPDNNSEGSLQIDLIKRGFDVETAKMIERDLLDATPIQDRSIQSTSNEEICVKKVEVSVTVSEKIESDSSTANNLQIVQEEDDVEEIELSVCECNEDSKNYVSCEFEESSFVPSNISKLKDKFSMELCIDDDLTIRLRANPFISLFDMEPLASIREYDDRETEDAVSSIANMEKLYTPMKDSRAQCYEIFDSTLTSIDTPLKTDLTTHETQANEIVVEVEGLKDVKDKLDNKKRKRLTSGSLEETLGKKSKPDTQYLFNSTNIQNIDIESVLSKLHGP